jgi:predicted metalloprotease
MRWSSGDRSNIEDRRGSGMRVGVPMGLGGILVLLVLSWLTGTNLLSLLGTDAGVSQQSQARSEGPPAATSPEEEKVVDFVDAVMKDLQETWTAKLGPGYRRTTLVLFRDAIQSACGFAESASGPFYCPGDGKVYIDLGFYQELRQRFGAPGDFAQAYVIAHEVGHHVQSLTGIEGQVRRAQEASPSQANALSVRMELQADCLAGVWGHEASQPGRFLQQGRIELEQGDVEEGLNAAAAIGDDRIQRMSAGRVFPDKFTHGSSAQRVEWFRRGLERGSVDSCDTFASGT